MTAPPVARCRGQGAAGHCSGLRAGAVPAASGPGADQDAAGPRIRRGGVRAVAFSPDGRLLATGGRDRMLLWDLTPAAR